MHLRSLDIVDLRNLEAVRLDAVPGVNWLFGVNGSGKTSVLEAIHLLARGRSFRSATLAPLIRDGARCLRVVATTDAPTHRLGVERSSGSWLGRMDGEDCRRVSDFARCLPLVLVDPQNHVLIEGPPAERRSFLDWLMFHVEQDYLEVWRRYQRGLRQRNAALRDQARSTVFDAIEASMADAAVAVDRARSRWVEVLARCLAEVEMEFGFNVPPLSLEYRPAGAEAEGYRPVWRAHRNRDRALGHTRDGPHRAELAVRSGGRMVANRFSRGQMKLAALLLKLAVLSLQQAQGQTPLLLLDDPVSELDRRHLDALLAWLPRAPGQVWITAVEVEPSVEARRFHVEQGKIRPVV